GKPVGLGMFLYGMADVAQGGARPYLFDAQPHACVSDVGQAACQYGWRPDTEHAAGIAIPAIFDDGDINIEDIARLEFLFPRNPVADHVVYRGADGAGKGRVARRLITDGGRLDTQLGHEIV